MLTQQCQQAQAVGDIGSRRHNSGESAARTLQSLRQLP
jgi:hypothetical protein